MKSEQPYLIRLSERQTEFLTKALAEALSDTELRQRQEPPAPPLTEGETGKAPLPKAPKPRQEAGGNDISEDTQNFVL